MHPDSVVFPGSRVAPPWLNGLLYRWPLPVLLLLASCAPDLDLDTADTETQRPIALFDLQEQQKLPWPNVVAQTRRTDTGELIIGPLNLPNPQNDPLLAQVNQLTGFTQLPVITVDFSRPISEASILPGVNLNVAGVNPANDQDVDVLGEDMDIDFDEDLLKLRIYPRRPLRPSFQYVVLLTKSIRGEADRRIQEDLFFRFTKYTQPLFDPETNRVLSDLLLAQDVGPEEAAQLEQLRSIYQRSIYGNPLILQAVRADLARDTGRPATGFTEAQVIDHVAVASAFVTATYPGGDPTAELDTAVADVLASGSAGGFFPGVTFPAEPFFAANAPNVPRDNLAFVAFGVITSLDYRGEDGAWATPVTSTMGSPVTVPVVVTYPRAITAGPVPVVIFQHGLGSCKTQAIFAVADSFAQAGFAVVGLDIVEHGDRTRTNADTSNDNEEPGACDQIIDGALVRTGEGFVRVDNLSVTRDALRQTVVDQTALAKALRAGAFNAVRGGGDFAPGSETFAALSLGGIVGSMFLAEQDIVNVGVVNATGVWLSRLFLESPAIGPPVLEGIAQSAGAGPVTGETFQDFLTKLVPLVQGLIDPAEPAYYLESALNGNNISAANSILLQQPLGDPVIPAFATETMARLAQLELVTPDTPVDQLTRAFPFPAWTQFDVAGHSVLLTPDNPATEDPDTEFLPVTAAMRQQMLNYLGSYLLSNGTALQVIFPQ